MLRNAAHFNRLHQGQRGAALLLVLLIAMTLGLAFLFRQPDFGRSHYAREQSTEEALAKAKEALIGYAATYRDTLLHQHESLGYLPCPDTDNTGIAQPNCGNAGETMIGRLPYKTLGLPDLHAAGGECLWYIVSGSHKNNPKTSPLNWDTRGQIRVVDNAGSILSDPADANGGAVAVIIAPGVPINAQARPGGTHPCSGDNTNTFNDYLDGTSPSYAGYVAPLPNPAVIALGKPADASNNDQGVWITAKELFSPIAMRNDLFVTAFGPQRTLLDELKSCLDAQITLPLPSTPTPRPNGNTQAVFLGNASSNFPASLTGCPVLFSAGFSNAWTNWKNQFGYVVCNNQTAGCLTVDGTSCRGVLIFSGRQSNGNPRATTDSFEAPPSSNTFLELPNLTSYLSADYNYAGPPPYNGRTSAKDITVCLKPDANALSFQDNFSQLAPVAANINGQSMISTDATNKMLTLGESGLSGNATGTAPALLFGCSWFQTPLSFGGSLRAYFRYRIVHRGTGFVFAIADADPSRNPNAAMCGRGDASLGYSGLPNDGNAIPGMMVAPIQYPKIGLEIDTAQDVPRNDPNAVHMAIVFWGNPAISDDDNVHSAPAVTVPGSPQNPPAVTRGIAGDTNVYRHVRLEIIRTPNSGGHSYSIKAWVLSILPPDFDILTADFDEDIVPAQIHTSANIADLTIGNEALRSIRVGFTNAASATSDQQIQITNFAIRTLP
jgi:hypothetical protein